MKRLIKRIVTLCTAFVVSFSATACGNIKLKRTVVLGDNGDLITNKGMGWNFCYYSNSLVKFGSYLAENDLLDDYPCDIVYFRIGWNFIQPDAEFAEAMGWTTEESQTKNGFKIDVEKCGEDYYFWDLIDPVVEKWTDAGKRVAFRITANDGWGQCTPLWVKEKGANGVEYDPITEGSFDKLSLKLSLNCSECGEFAVEENSDGKYACPQCGKDVEVPEKTDDAYEALKQTDENGNYVYSEASMETVYSGFTEEGRTWYDSGENGHVLGEGRKTWCPDYGDEIFLSYYKKMLEKLRDRYGEYIEFIEIGSFGTWGEGHSNRALPTKDWVTSDVGRENVLKHFKMHKEVFGDEYLVIAGDTMAERLNVSQEILDYGFGCTDDSVQVPGMSGSANSAILKPLYDDGAVTALETHPGTISTELYYDGVNDCCASYARIIHNPAEMKTSEWTDKITKRLGYRLTFTEAKLSDFKVGGKFKVELSLKNTGAARCTVSGRPAVVILDDSGRETCKAISNFDVKSLETISDPTALSDLADTKVSVTLDIPSGLDKGRYYVCVCVVDEDDEPAFNLPLDDGYNMLYRIAAFEVK